MRSSFTLCLSMCAWPLLAQPVIQLQDAPQPGDVAPYGLFSPLFELLPGGEDQTWDLSAMVPNEMWWTLRFAVPDTTPGASIYPAADLACMNDASFDDWFYYRISDFGLENLGIYYEGQLYGAAPYPERLMPYPLSLGTTWLDTVQWCADSNVCRLQYRTCEADGYGTLILPAGTVGNVLRTRCTQGSYSDINGVIIADTLMTDRYWSPDLPFLLATVYNGIHWSSGIYSFFAEADLLTDLTVGISAHASSRPALSASFASATGRLTVTTGLDGPLRSEVMDAMGRVMSSAVPGAVPPGQRTVVVALPALSTGRYIHRLQDDHGRMEAVPFMVVE